MAGTKEPVRLRMKELKGGGASLYLDIYSDGQRKYEFLKLYLVPESEEGAKARNRETMRIANIVKARRVLELQEGRAGLTRDARAVSVLDFAYTETMKRDGATRSSWLSMLNHLTAFCGGSQFPLSKVTPDWVESVKHHFLNECGLSKNSAVVYYTHFVAFLNAAYKRRLISFRPSEYVQKPKMDDSRRVFLTAEEVARLASAPCPNDLLKRAFLFSCYSGLRLSDVTALTWEDITLNEDGTAKVMIRQKKTRNVNTIEIPPVAVSFLDEDDGSGRGLCFRTLANLRFSFAPLFRSWLKAAKITKHVTFHTARHTFATLMLNEGVDLYVVSKLLGHADVKTTEIYAKIVDSTKRDAMNKLCTALQKCQTSNKTEQQKTRESGKNEEDAEDKS